MLPPNGQNTIPTVLQKQQNQALFPEGFPRIALRSSGGEMFERLAAVLAAEDFPEAAIDVRFGNARQPVERRVNRRGSLRG
jgi:hypothetical protein